MRCLVFVYCVIPLAAASAQQPDSTHVLPQITVTASRLPDRLLHAPVHVTVLDARRARTVSELLSKGSAIYIRQYSGGLATLSQRGAGAAQTVVLLDGHRIASPQLGQLDLSLIPTLLLSSVEIASGAGSSVYGTDALAGVVNLRTAAAPPGLTVQASRGSFGQRTGAMSASVSTGALAGQLAAEYVSADGDYPYLNTGFFPARSTPRRGADQKRRSLYAVMQRPASRGGFNIAAWINQAERGLPSIHASVPRRERQWDRHLRVWASVNWQARRAAFLLSGLAQQGSLRYANDQLGIDDTGRTLISSLDAEARLAVGSRWRLTGGLSSGFGQARHPSLSAAARQWHGAAFATAVGHYRRLRLYPALRMDAYSSRLVRNPRLGLNMQLAGSLHLKASAGRAFRMPTFNDRFWQPGGNPDLRPEHGWTYDLGMRLESRRGHAELSTFASRITDQIIWQPTPDGYWAPRNLFRLRGRGLEAEGAWRQSLSSAMSAAARLTVSYVDSREMLGDTRARAVRLLPREQIKGALHLSAGPFLLETSARYTGTRSVATDGTLQLPAFLLLDAHALFRGRSGHATTTLGVFVDNVLNTRYEYLSSSPMPPRVLRLQLTLHLHYRHEQTADTRARHRPPGASAFGIRPASNGRMGRQPGQFFRP